MQKDFKKLENKIAELAKILDDIRKFVNEEEVANKNKSLVDFTKIPELPQEELDFKKEIMELNDLELEEYEGSLLSNQKVNEMLLLKKVVLFKKELQN